MTRRPIPKIYVTRFFQLTTTRQFAEAERILQRLKQKMHVSEHNRGYYQALNGILLTRKNNDDRYAFLSNLNLNSKKELPNHRREFVKQSESHLYAEYDKGFFAAWADYMSVLTKMELPTPPEPALKTNRVEKREIEEIGIETETEAETRKEAIDEKREKPKEESKTEETKNPKEMEKLDIRQSTLFDFSK